MRKIIFLLFAVQLILFTSCEDNEEYTAQVLVINEAKTQVENFNFELEGLCFSNTIEKLDTLGIETFTVSWIGESWGIGGGKENKDAIFEISYYINSTFFNVENEEGAQIDSYGNYYSEKTITNGNSVIITIADNDYDIKIVE